MNFLQRNWIPLLLLAIAVVLAVVFWDGKCASEAQARTGNKLSYPLRMGDIGKQVCSAQWLMTARKPSKYRAPRFHTYRKQVYKKRCRYGAATAQAVRRIKIQLGYPAKRATNTFGRDLRQILIGRRARPKSYRARSAKFNVPPCTIAGRAASVARGELGVREYGNNGGSRVHTYQSYTGAYNAPWCASFTQFVMARAGLGTFCGRSAGVFFIVSCGGERGWLVSRPQTGDLVAFMDRLGHIGLVERASRGGFYSIEGNASNQVLRRFHPYGGRSKRYVRLPGLQRRVKC